MLQLVYKIRRKSDGYYSCGSCPARFSKNGKVWSSIGALKNHLVLFEQNRYSYIDFWKQSGYDDCEIVCYEKIERETDFNGQKVMDHYNPNKKKETHGVKN